MQLLIAVINYEEHIDDVLAGFIELGITGATVVDSEGMGHVLNRHPAFAGLKRSVGPRSRPINHTVFSVIDDAKIDDVIGMIQRICGSLEEPGAGIVFTMPVSRVVGLAPMLDADVHG